MITRTKKSIRTKSVTNNNIRNKGASYLKKKVAENELFFRQKHAFNPVFFCNEALNRLAGLKTNVI